MTQCSKWLRFTSIFGFRAEKDKNTRLEIEMVKTIIKKMKFELGEEKTNESKRNMAARGKHSDKLLFDVDIQEFRNLNDRQPEPQAASNREEEWRRDNVCLRKLRKMEKCQPQI